MAELEVTRPGMQARAGRVSIRLDSKVSAHIPPIGSGYADAIIQDALNMNIVNDYRVATAQAITELY